MLNINSLNSRDRDFFLSHYRIIETNASSIDEIEVFCLGENHENRCHKVKHIWLLSKLFQEGDTLLIESPPLSEEQKKIFQVEYLNTANAKIDGWDSLAARQRLNALISKISSGIETIKNRQTMEKSHWFNQMGKMITENDCMVKVQELQENLSLDSEDLVRLVKLKSYIKRQKDLRGSRKKKSLNEYVKITAKIWFLYFCMEFALLDCKRNLSMCQNTQVEEKGKRVFLIAGKKHLSERHSPNKWRKFLQNASNLQLDSTLKQIKGRKYAILFPNRKRDLAYQIFAAGIYHDQRRLLAPTIWETIFPWPKIFSILFSQLLPKNVEPHFAGYQEIDQLQAELDQQLSC